MTYTIMTGVSLALVVKNDLDPIFALTLAVSLCPCSFVVLWELLACSIIAIAFSYSSKFPATCNVFLNETMSIVVLSLWSLHVSSSFDISLLLLIPDINIFLSNWSSHLS